MILRGFIEGVEVTFDFYPPNTFKASFPKQLDGTYIVELHAIDDAGNETAYTNLFVLIDFQNMIFKVLEADFDAINANDRYQFRVLEPGLGYGQISSYKAVTFDQYFHRLVIS